MEIQQGIKKAINEGGYSKAGPYCESLWREHWKYQILLDPEFWQALGAAEKWVQEEELDTPPWYYKMHDLVENLSFGQSLEEAFKNTTK